MKAISNPNKFIGLGALVLGLTSMSSFIYKVHPGERAITLNRFFGQGVSKVVKKEGYHFMIPLVQEIIKYDIKIQPFDFASFTSTKDMQKVSVKVKIYFRWTY